MLAVRQHVSKAPKATSAVVYVLEPAHFDDVGADVCIVVRKHRENALIRRQEPVTYRENSVPPLLTMRELLAAKAGRLISV
jgi:hypothetical protein